jgi:hypothetical protein
MFVFERLGLGPFIADSKVNQLRRALKSLISCDFYNAGVF